MRNQRATYSRTFFSTIIQYFYAEFIYKREVFGKLYKKITNLNGHHQRIFYTCFFSHKSNQLFFQHRLHSSRGRAHGKHVCLSKGYRNTFRFYKSNLAVGNLTFLFSLVRVFYIPQLTKLYGLVLASNRQQYITPITARMSLFKLSLGCLFFSTFSWERELTITFKHLRKCDSLLYMRLQSHVCLVSLQPYTLPLYIRSSGCTGVVVRKFFLDSASGAQVLIRLPSGYTKLFSICVCAFFGFVCLREHALLKNTRAGFHRNLGQRPTVRGVVKNPVDHPHGGRERTVLWPRSPWGWSTK